MNSVQNLYKGWFGRSYDSMKHSWNRIVASKAESLLSDFLMNNLDESKSILELGCGTALNLETIKSLNLNFNSYLGLDFSENMLKKAEGKFANIPNIRFQQKDIAQLSEIKDKYDIIICTWVLSHLNSPSQVVNQAQELLNNGGKMFLIFLTKPKWYVNIWFNLIAKYLFRSKYVSNGEIEKMNNVKNMHHFFAHIVTTVEICKD
jgi:2-polyprenyl-3-methyl-5-hydroxy-6-metoxy-1,4-benzoquinol methylase